MHKWTVILLSALVLVSGCDTASRSGPRRAAQERPPDWGLPAETNSFPTPMPLEIAPFPSPPTNAPATNAPPTKPPSLISKSPEAIWLSLARWSEEHGFGQPHRIATAPVETYSLSSSNGTLTITNGSRAARWNGVELRLGFAPRMVDKQVFLNSLDGRKSFAPLLGGIGWPTKTNRVIVIDAGHGGSNYGTRSVTDGSLEKTFTLDWALRLARLLETNQWQVFLTRTNDADISLTNRVNFATQHGADFFLSLHFNDPGGVNADVAGLETYCLTPTGMASTLTRGYPDNVTDAFPNNAFDAANFAYAVRLHAALLKVNGHLDRAVRRARFPGVLRGQNCPAVLIEGGYLSNPREARKIADPAYRQRLAEAVAEGLK